MYMTAIKEINRHIIYIIIRHCYFVAYAELLPRTTTQGINIIFSGKLTRRVVKVWAPEMISTYISDHKLCHNLANRLLEIGREPIMAAITEKLEFVNISVNI